MIKIPEVWGAVTAVVDIELARMDSRNLHKKAHQSIDDEEQKIKDEREIKRRVWKGE